MTNSSTSAGQARENARDRASGRFGEQHLADPGSSVLAGDPDRLMIAHNRAALDAAADSAVCVTLAQSATEAAARHRDEADYQERFGARVSLAGDRMGALPREFADTLTGAGLALAHTKVASRLDEVAASYRRQAAEQTTAAARHQLAALLIGKGVPADATIGLHLSPAGGRDHLLRLTDVRDPDGKTLPVEFTGREGCTYAVRNSDTGRYESPLADFVVTGRFEMAEFTTWPPFLNPDGEH